LVDEADMAIRKAELGAIGVQAAGAAPAAQTTRDRIHAGDERPVVDTVTEVDAGHDPAAVSPAGSPAVVDLEGCLADGDGVAGAVGDLVIPGGAVFAEHGAGGGIGDLPVVAIKIVGRGDEVVVALGAVQASADAVRLAESLEPAAGIGWAVEEAKLGGHESAVAVGQRVADESSHGVALVLAAVAGILRAHGLGAVEPAVQGGLLDIRQQERQAIEVVDIAVALIGARDDAPAIALACRRELLVGAFVMGEGHAQLLEVIGTLDAAGRLAYLLYGREQQADEDANDGNDHQEFDQGKGAAPVHRQIPPNK